MKLKVVIHEAEEGGYWAEVPAILGCAIQGNRLYKHLNRISFLCAILLFIGSQTVFATPTTPTGNFIDNKDGTVTHKTTGLTWMRCAIGQKWTGSTCAGTASSYFYDQAVALKRSFAGP